MKIIAFGNLKGGVGKTLLTFNLGGLLAEQGKKVLLIDSDLQGNLTNNIGVDRTLDGLKTTYDIFDIDAKNQAPATDVIMKAPIEEIPTLDVIIGSIFLHKAELKISSVAGRELILKNYIDDNRSTFEEYDYILIDTNPSMSLVNQNAFLVADSIVIVSDVSMNSVEGAQLFIALWEESRRRLRKDNNIKGFIINDFDKRNKLSSDFLEFINSGDGLEDLQKIKFETIIPRNVKLTESELGAKPINIMDKHAKGYDALVQLVQEMKIKEVL